MLHYNREPNHYIGINKNIPSFILGNEQNIDIKTVSSFGQEWARFSDFEDKEINAIAGEYFDIVSDKMLSGNSLVLDIGCGSGRWSKYLSSKVKFIEAIDPSEAVFSAQKMLANSSNVRITQAGVDAMPFPDNSFDFVLSLGVFHHLPDTQKAIDEAVRKLKVGGYFLLYLYYNLDNRNFLYKFLFHCSSLIRIFISNLPNHIKNFMCDLLAIFIYMPFIWLSRMVKMTFSGKSWYLKIPLSYYIDKSFTVIRNDSLDRFGTPLEKRFSKKEIETMLRNSGLQEIKFSEHPPYWHSISKKVKS